MTCCNTCSANSDDDANRRFSDGGCDGGWNDQSPLGPERELEVDDTSTSSKVQASQAPATFGGFSVTAMHTMRHLEDLSQRNIILNCTEAAISALLLLGTLRSETPFGVTERLLHIVACTSSAGYLWCAPCRTAVQCALQILMPVPSVVSAAQPLPVVPMWLVGHSIGT